MYVPEYKEQDETDKRAVLPDGLPLAVSLRNAVHASTTGVRARNRSRNRISIFLTGASLVRRVTGPREVFTTRPSVLTRRSGTLSATMSTILSLTASRSVADTELRTAFSAHSTFRPRSVAMLAVAGLLVGVGTTLGNGCTSGHGVCGIGRVSPRSILATITFIATGVATVAVLHWGGWS